jgi:hypothetical protein
LKSLRQLRNDGGFLPIGADAGPLMDRVEKALINDVETCIFTGDLKAKLQVTVGLRYPTGESAARAKGTLEELIAEAKRKGEWENGGFNRLQTETVIATHGRYADVTFTCDSGELLKQIKGMRGGGVGLGNGNQPWSVGPGARHTVRAPFQAGTQVTVTATANDFQKPFAVLVYDPQNRLVAQANAGNGIATLSFIAPSAGQYALVIENRSPGFLNGNLNYFALNRKF